MTHLLRNRTWLYVQGQRDQSRCDVHLESCTGFILLRDYIKKWYEFRNSLTQDDSKDNSERLEKKIESKNANDNDIVVTDDTINIDLIDDTD
jgi:hypothetical protein